MALSLTKRGAHWYVRGTVAGARLYESARTGSRPLAERYRDRRELELYESRALADKPWATIPPAMLEELMSFVPRVQKASQKRGMRHSISYQYILHLYLQQRGRCAVSGLPFRLDTIGGTGTRHRAFAPSLDRIDNSRGYHQGNVRIVCRIANFAMNVWGEATLLELALGVTDVWERSCKSVHSPVQLVETDTREAVNE